MVPTSSSSNANPVTSTASNPSSLNSSSERVMFQGKAFTLVDESECWGFKVWDLILDLEGEKVNKFDQVVLNEFKSVLEVLESKGPTSGIEALVLRSGKDSNFIAGADIRLIQSAQNEAQAKALSLEGHALFTRWEDLPFPTIVAIEGSTMGGGCELALASTAIVMSNSKSTSIGLPEVLLGLLPGLGGCVRLPQRVGIANALDMILTGKTLNGNKAARIGLADACLNQESFQVTAHQWVQRNLKKLRSKAKNKSHVIGKGPKLGGMGGLMGSLLENNPLGRSVIFKKAKQGVLSKTKGHYPAPLKAIDTIQAIGSRVGVGWNAKKRQAAIEKEAQAFAELSQTDVSKNLIHLFFLTEEVKRSTGLPASSLARAKTINTAGVLGAGVMGGGIAQLFAAKAIPTRMKDISVEGLESGISTASGLFSKQKKRKKITQREFLQKLSQITPTLNYEGFQGLDLIVEAVVENMDLKKKVLAELESKISEDCIVATNTSSLSVSEMQKAFQKPQRFCGMHFFNPVHRMPLIEVIRGESSSDEAVSTVYAFSKKLGKTPIVVKDAPGFLVNRLLAPYLNESAYLLADGVPINEIDQALLDFGMPMGPVELIDEVGVDVGAKVVKVLHEAFGDRMPPAALIEKVVSTKRLGKKNLKGFYEYEKEGSRLKKTLSPQIYQLLEVKPEPKKLDAQAIVERCIYPMVNEAIRCLDEKIVEKPQDVDLGMIMGTGFAPFRGGLLRYADQVGLEPILYQLKTLAQKHGKRFEPSEGLVSRASSKTQFYS